MNIRSMNIMRLASVQVASGLVGVTVPSLLAGSNPQAASPTPAIAAGAQVTGGAPGAIDFSQTAARHGGAVVNISVSGMRRVAANGDRPPTVQPRAPQGIDPNGPFFEFFRHTPGPGGGNPGPQDQPIQGKGSGFIVRADGIIATNAHGVRDAKDGAAKLTDRRAFRAKVPGTDPKTDVAVRKIDANDLPVVPPGSSRDLRVGEWVMAIGSPVGFESSVTAGVQSAKGRSLPDDSFVPFIQTDVAVKPGNSGGPLFNKRGEVVCIHSQIDSRTGGYQRLSFATPIDLAMKVDGQILATGKASHARLAAAVQDVDQALADSFRLDKPEGALVSNVEQGCLADKAGLQVFGKPGLALRALQPDERREAGVDGGLLIEGASSPAALAGAPTACRWRCTSASPSAWPPTMRLPPSSASRTIGERFPTIRRIDISRAFAAIRRPPKKAVRSPQRGLRNRPSPDLH